MPVSTRSRSKNSSDVVEPPHRKKSEKNMNASKLKAGRMYFGFNIDDFKSILLLTFLYLLQGIPLGLAGSVPYILQSRKADYKSQATFSFVFWPFSLKLLWAPIVDAVSWARFGRRKSWLVPVQYFIGIAMLLTSMNVSDWLGENVLVDNKSWANNNTASKENSHEAAGSTVEIVKMTAAFFFLNFLAATQDIVVDGWALTMLSRENVGWASTCNTIGQTLGYYIAFIFFLALESSDFCNTWLRSQPQPYGVITFSGFLVFWGIVFMVTTTLVAFLKSEKKMTARTKRSSETMREPLLFAADGEEEEIMEGSSLHDNDQTSADSEGELELGLWDTYRVLFNILKLRPIQQFILLLFVVKFGFSAADSVTGLKLIEKGVSKERLAFLGVCLVPLQTILPLAISRWSAGPKPLTLYINAAIPRMFMSLLFAVVVFVTPYFQDGAGSYPLTYYASLLLVYAVHQLFAYTMFVTQIAFHAKVSDPVIGGTYMTLLNTAANLAGTLPSTILLYLVDPMSSKSCVGGTLNGSNCIAKADLTACTTAHGKCVTDVDGYYIEIGICFILGILAIIARYRNVKVLESLPPKSWSVIKVKKACC